MLVSTIIETAETVTTAKTATLRILLIEDNSADALVEMLTNNSETDCHISHVNSLSDALERLRHDKYDVALLDINLPDAHGLDSIYALYKQSPELPVVLLSGGAKENTALITERLGTLDCIPENITEPSQILPTLHHAIKHKKDELQLVTPAFQDPVSGLANRHLFVNSLKQSMRRCDRSKERLALMFLDLDNFKAINDKWGYEVGNQVLRQCAQRLSHCIRKQDFVARLSGDKFAIILENIKGRRNAERVAHKIMASLNQPLDIEGSAKPCSVSIGISFYDGQIEFPAKTLMEQTDIALRQAKKVGHNNYRYFLRNLTKTSGPANNISDLLDHALEQNEFRLHFQPQIDTESDELVGAEALLRWNSKALGSVLPSAFIPLLEDSGHIIEVGEWVLKNACQHWSDWIREGRINPTATISVNLSAVQFTQKDIVKTVANSLSETGLKACQLDLELTENALLNHTERNLQILKKLKDLGISLTIDDFGTGFSSLPYLKHFYFDRLKVDRSYVNHVLDNSVDAAISSSIINLAENLDLKVIAEGVDSWDKVSRIQSYGCTIMQGYYYSRPLTEQTFIERYACTG